MAPMVYFRVLVLLILGISTCFLPVHSNVSIVGVTSTPYGAGQLARFAFIVKAQSSTLLRAVKLGRDLASENLSTLNYAYDGTSANFVSTTDTAVGAFRGIDSVDGQEAIIIILPNNGDLEPSGGRVTVTASIGDTVTLSVENRIGVNESEIEWQRFSDFSTFQTGGLSYTVLDVKAEDADYYGTFQTGQRALLKYSLIQLIVRECPPGYYSAPSCNLVCPNCYNGGVCSDVSGECICAPGYDGPNCLTACGESMFGWECSQSCGTGNTLAVCPGSRVCLPHPYGCNCLSGYSGNDCNSACPTGTYGAGCEGMCHCSAPSLCDRFTGECPDGQCADGWSGSNCQVPTMCPAGYYGVNCTDLCNCLNNGACDKSTGDCYSTGGLCMPGYASNQVQLADCQSYEGCFDNCTKTCHCQGGPVTCDEMTGVCNGRCQSEWIGPTCQTGVVHSAYTKANQGQPASVMCVFKSPEMLASLTVSMRLGTAVGPTLASDTIDNIGQLFNVTFVVTNGATLVYCEVSSDGESASSGVSLDYFALPTLTTPPSVLTFGDDNASIDWLGWKAENDSMDGGEGPIVGYAVYYHHLNGTSGKAGFVSSNESDLTGRYEYMLANLSPGMTYSFSISAVREGEGGEGPRGPVSQAVTLPERMTTKGTTESDMATTLEATAGGPLPASDDLLLYIIIPVVIVVCIVIIVVVMVYIGVHRRNRRKMFQERRERIVLETQAVNDYTDEQQAENHNEAYEEKTYLTASVDETDSKPEKEKTRGKAPSHPISAPPEAPVPPTRPSSHHPRPIVVADFAAYVQRNRRSRAFENEWSLLPPDISQPCQTARLPSNKVKNRYRNILAYDHSRVVLEKVEGEPNSDYINACYMESFDKEKMYIATQGPNKASLADFWRMILMENVHNIVMVTNLVEEGKNKCLQYWPNEGDTLLAGSIQVTCKRVEVCHRYVIRILKADNGSESRTLKQYHYQGWPDKGVPKFAGPVLKMIKDIDESQESAGDVPLLVHCSAGAGRTGVIIAIDSILREAKKSDEIDIFSFVNSMRENRPQMVQTPEQYAFVHEAVLEGLLCGDTFILEADISESVEQMQWPDPHTDKTHIQHEFEILGIMSSDDGAGVKSAGSSPENETKNRYSHIIPEDRSRPYLMTPGDNSVSNNYINASFVSGYSKKNGFITTQMPLENTVIDFWRLVHDYRISTIVMLNQLNHKTCSIYWPVNSKNVTFGPFTVDHKGSENMNRVKVRTLELQFKEEVHEIRQFEVQDWPRAVQPGQVLEQDQSMDAVLQLMDYLHKCEIQRNEEQGRPGDGPPILVHCMSGIEESGVFCTVMNCLEQLSYDGAIDVFQNLRLLRLSRPNLVSNLNDYLLCYRFLDRHHTLYGYEEEQDYDNRIPTEGLYQNVDHSMLRPSDTHSLASEC